MERHGLTICRELSRLNSLTHKLGVCKSFLKKSIAFIFLNDICHSDKRNGSYYSNFPGFFSVNKHKDRLYVYTTLILSQYATDKSVDSPREDKFHLAS